MKFIKKNFVSMILVLTFLVGVGLLAYPTIANWWNTNMASHAVSNYTEAVQNIDETKITELLEEAKKYNEELVTNAGRFHPTPEEHERYLKELIVEGSKVIGSVHIPSIKVSLPIYLTTSEEVLAMGAGHLEGSSLPVGGDGTHTVITGHRGLPSAELFTNLDQLEEDDYVVLKVLNETLTYQIRQIRVVLPDELNDLNIEPQSDLLTLVTCTPYGVNTHRLLLTGERVDNLPEDFNGTSEAKLIDPKIVALFLAMLILIGLLIWLFVHDRAPESRR